MHRQGDSSTSAAWFHRGQAQLRPRHPASGKPLSTTVEALCREVNWAALAQAADEAAMAKYNEETLAAAFAACNATLLASERPPLRTTGECACGM
jgi:hypothetical protein